MTLEFLNKYLKSGTLVQGNWAFFARGDIEKIIQAAYEGGRNDERVDIQIDKAGTL